MRDAVAFPYSILVRSTGPEASSYKCALKVAFEVGGSASPQVAAWRYSVWSYDAYPARTA